jgi:hypothetical protein
MTFWIPTVVAIVVLAAWTLYSRVKTPPTPIGLNFGRIVEGRSKLILSFS